MTAITAVEAQRVLDQADRLFDAAQIRQAVDRIAHALRALRERNPLILSVMNGGLIPTGHLLTRLPFVMELDYIHATRYNGATQGGELVWRKRPDVSLRGRVVVIIDDILDEGLTLQAVRQYCLDQEVEEVISIAMVQKLRAQPPAIAADLVGLEVPDRYVFGFGMDYKGFHRNLDGIYAAREEDA